jgi:apolipoprotein N-acyltransferase
VTLLAAFVAGAAAVLGFSPIDLFPLTLLALAVLVHLWLRAPSPRAAFLAGYCFGLGYFLAGVSWVYVSLHRFGGMPAPVAAFATFGFCAFLALFPALAGWAQARLARIEFSDGFGGLSAGAVGTAQRRVHLRQLAIESGGLFGRSDSTLRPEAIFLFAVHQHTGVGQPGVGQCQLVVHLNQREVLVDRLGQLGRSRELARYWPMNSSNFC